MRRCSDVQLLVVVRTDVVLQDILLSLLQDDLEAGV